MAAAAANPSTGTTETMLAGFYENDKCALRRVPIPSLDGLMPGTVLVKGLKASLCGTDMLCFHHLRDIDHCPGGSVHEVIGEVVAVAGGAEAPTSLAVGTKVLALPTNYMASGNFRGFPADEAARYRQLPLTGGLCQYFLSHASHCYPLPDLSTCPPGTKLDHFTAAQPIGTILWMLRKAPTNFLAKTAVVVGQGQNGLLLTHLLSNLGCKKIVALDKCPERLEVARAMKATDTILVGDDHSETQRAVLAATDGKGGDFVFEMVGHQPETINQCMDFAADCGTVFAFGVPCNPVYESFAFGPVFFKNVHLIGSCGPLSFEDFPLGVDHVGQGRMDVAPVFTQTFPLARVQEAFALVTTSKGACVKVLVDLQQTEAD